MPPQDAVDQGQYAVRELSREKRDLANPEKVEAAVRTYFEDTPIMVEIAQCESHYRHLDQDGEIHRGEVNNQDVGVMQINEYYHLESSQKLGYDIYTLEGNLGYAQYLYEKQGTQPWASSSPCWKPKLQHLAQK